jgi:DNA (cytosine-5)-methyltransferase 1
MVDACQGLLGACRHCTRRHGSGAILVKYLSVCSGIEAATMAWHHMGWQPVAFSDIEKFPSAVLAHHYPDVPNLGDMTQFEEWNLDSIDLLVGGTPCQSFSVAGLRRGLADPRGNLMLTFLAIAQRQRPRWIVWENVPGVLSSNGGRDFGTFLGALGELGYGWAYRVLDAQWFGVAQRRRRVFVVGYLGDWRRAAAVLFERESVSRNPAPSREKGQEVAGGSVPGVAGGCKNSKGVTWPAEVASTLSASFGSKLGLEDQHALGGAQLFVPDVMGTITARMFNALGARDVEEGAVLPMAFDWQSGGDARGLDPKETAMLQRNQVPAVAQPMTQFGDVAGSLTARHDSSPCADRGQNVVAQPMAFSVCPDHCGGDKSGQDVAFVNVVNVSRTLDCTGADVSRKQGGIGIAHSMQARRLTPVECERLQGFPDGYTNIPWRNKSESPDGPRYKALGNSMAVPVMRWIGERINKVENDQHD